MAASILDSFLVGNKPALKMGIRVSISVWGAMIIALLLDFEHPTWAMITGMISFFAPAHAQVVKKCLFQCIATVSGGLLGFLIMATLGQSPLMACFATTIIIFIAGAFSFHTRDANVTFCCAIFAVTVPIMVMVTVTLGPSTETITAIFIDRVGTILAGIVWAGFMSAVLWPEFSSDAIKSSGTALFKMVLELGVGLDSSPLTLPAKLDSIYGAIIGIEDAASHCDFEGYWGQRSARLGREMNRLAVEVISEAYALHQIGDRFYAENNTIVLRLDQILSTIIAGGFDQLATTTAALDVLIGELSASAQDGGDSLDRTATIFCNTALGFAVLLRQFIDVYSSLIRSERVAVASPKIKRHLQLANCLITGTRSALLFLCAFFVWYATGWRFGFLGAVVPVVFSMMLGKLPHPEMILKSIIIGMVLAMIPGTLVFILQAQAPSAVEILIVIAAPFLLFGLMGLSSLKSFAYCLGFNISFIVYILPQNVPQLDIGFAIERTISICVGAVILAGLFIFLPRRPVLTAGDGDGIASLYAPEITSFLTASENTVISHTELSARIGLIIDKMMHVAVYELPEKKVQLIRKGSQAIFIMIQVHRICQVLIEQARAHVSASGLRAWRVEIAENYRRSNNKNDMKLINALSSPLSAQHQPPDLATYPFAMHIIELDHLITQSLLIDEDRQSSMKGTA